MIDGAKASELQSSEFDQQMLRERCLGLAHQGDTVGRSHKQIIDRAKAFEAYVIGSQGGER